MAFEMSTPDIANYIHRINQIQRVIVPESAVMPSPRNGGSNDPYWLTLARNVAITRSTQSAVTLTITIDMLLIRGGAQSGYEGQREKEILSDMALTVSYFERHRDLVTTTYPAMQAYYVPGSATLTQVTRFEGQVQGNADVIGSLYTLQFQHRLVKTTTSTETP